MWVFTQVGFLSIVEDRGDPNNLLVRGRVKGDIEAIFPEVEILKDRKVEHTPEHDYAYRISLPRALVAQRLSDMIRLIDYDNFKASVQDPDRLTAYHWVWSVMAKLQDERQEQHNARNSDRPEKQKRIRGRVRR